LKQFVIDWLRNGLGYLTNSTAWFTTQRRFGIMHALAVAREEAAPATRKVGLTDRNLPRLRVYTSDQAHSSAEKAANRPLAIGEET